MSDKHPIDDLFKDKLQQHSYEPPMHIWDAIAAKRSTSALTPEKATFPWWTLGLVAALLTIGIFVMQLTSTHTEDIRKQREDNQTTSQTVTPIAVVPEPKQQTTKILTNTTPTKSTDDKVITYPSFPAVDKLPTRSAKLATNSVHTSSLSIRNGAYAPEIPQPSTSSPFLMNLHKTSKINISRSITDPPSIAFEGTKIWKSAIDFILSPNIVDRTLQAEASEYDAYAAARKETETFHFGYTGGVRYSTTSPSGIAIRAGLFFSQIHDRFLYEEITDERITITTEFGPDGQIIGADTIVDYTTIQYKANNQYTMVDIPLMIGYEFPIGKNFSLGVNGGTFVNLMFTQKGEFLSSDTFEPVTFSNQNNNNTGPFRSQLGLSLYGSMGLTYKLSDKLDFLVEPHINWRPQSVTNKGFGVEQRYTTSGIFLGLRKKV